MRQIDGYRAFLTIWAGQLFSVVGSTLTAFGLSVWAYLETDSVTASAMVSFAYSIPVIFVAPVAGAVVDRWNRRTAMIVGDCGAALATVVVALLLYRDASPMWHYYVVVGLGSAFTSLQWPAFNASVTLLVPAEQFPRANGLVQLAQGVSRVVAPGLGGVLLLAVGMLGIVVVDLATFLLALGTLMAVRIPRPVAAAPAEEQPGEWTWSEVFGGWSYLGDRRPLVALMAVFAVSNFVVGAVGVLVVPLVVSIGSAAELGGVLSLGGAGMILGSLFAGAPALARRKVPSLLLCMLVSGVAIAAAGVRPSLAWIACAAFTFFVTLAIFNALVQSLLQAKVSAHLQGRVFAVQTLVSASAFPIAYLAAGPLADRVFEPLLMPGGALAEVLGGVLGVGEGRGTGLLFIVLGGLLAVAAVAAYAVPRLRHLEEELPDVNREESGAGAPAGSADSSESGLAGGRRAGGLRRRALRFGIPALLVVSLVLAGLVWFHQRLHGSLPRLEGTIAVSGLGDVVEVQRDRLGIPTIEAADRADVAFAMGFVHAQDRFFQMDLHRRFAAGELAEIFGLVAVDADREVRVHRFRARARDLFERADRATRDLVEAYARGVNAGLASIEAPFEYLVLNVDPGRWRPEDSYLVLFSMFLQLQDENGRTERLLAQMNELLPPELYEFLTPAGTSWDTPLWGEPLDGAPIPGEAVVDLRRGGLDVARAERADHGREREFVPGSNSWAVSGEVTAHRGAILANDIHVELSVPNFWYRMVASWRDPGGEEHWWVGATLPGTPTVVVGSNGSIAWGFTNALVDTTDLVELELDADREGFYRTPGGWRELETAVERIVVKNGQVRRMEVRSTIWGPVLESEPQRAVRWTAHEREAVDFDVWRLERAGTVDEAMELAPRLGIPVQNILVADSAGRIGWTLAGSLPNRVGFDGELPTSWSDGGRRWDGLLDPREVPRVVDPPDRRLWSANQRMVSGPARETVRGQGYDLGARARQIRDRLFALDGATERDMLGIQLDDAAWFLERWRGLLLRVLEPAALEGRPLRQAFRREVEDWEGRAGVDAVGYRLVRTFRQTLARQVFDRLTAACREADSGFDYTLQMPYFEGPLWRMVTTRPAHLIAPVPGGWDGQLLAAVDETISRLVEDGTALSETTWGERNRSRLSHPLSASLPMLGRWLDMEPRPLPGDNHMPRVQHPAAGASLRMVVSPGREEDGLFHMPTGQSGHPLSPHYRDSHAAWETGEATPLLPGTPVHVLRMEPASRREAR